MLTDVHRLQAHQKASWMSFGNPSDFWLNVIFRKASDTTCSFKEQYHLFRSLEPPVEIVGVSQDTAEDHKQFKEELELPFTLLSDEDRAVADAFGVPVHLGRFPAKSSFVIDPEGIIRHVYDWQFRPRHHVAKILDALSSITE